MLFRSVPGGPLAWRERLNSDAAGYGGGDVGNDGQPLAVQPVPAHGQAQSISLNLPPLAVLMLVPA